MKAVVHHTYGAPEVLTLADVGKPVPGPDEVLLRVRASSVNPYDWHFMRGTPAPARLVGGLRAPRQPILGADVAGEVEAAGDDVTRFRPGEEVFGFVPGRGCLAEYVSVPERLLAPKPDGLTFEQAAAIPLAALTALQGLRDHGRIEAGEQVLVNGAAGGVGSFAVQLAKALGAEVTAVCSTRNVDLVRGIGADHVVDYTREDFTAGERRYDLLLDNVGNRRLADCRRVLRPDAVFVSVAGLQPLTHWLGVPRFHLKVRAADLAWSQRVVALPMVKTSLPDLAFVAGLVRDGKLTPVIDRAYPLRDAPEAIRYVEAGHARGKVVVTV